MSGQAATAGPRPPVRLLVADGDPSRITLTVLPRKWNTGPLDAAMVADRGGEGNASTALATWFMRPPT